MPVEARRIMKTQPHCPFLSNLNEDPQLSGVIIHYLDADKVGARAKVDVGNLSSLAQLTTTLLRLHCWLRAGLGGC